MIHCYCCSGILRWAWLGLAWFWSGSGFGLALVWFWYLCYARYGCLEKADGIGLDGMGWDASGGRCFLSLEGLGLGLGAWLVGWLVW